MQIKCIMDENTGPPCKRCAEKNLVSILCTSFKYTQPPRINLIRVGIGMRSEQKYSNTHQRKVKVGTAKLPPLNT